MILKNPKMQIMLKNPRLKMMHKKLPNVYKKLQNVFKSWPKIALAVLLKLKDSDTLMKARISINRELLCL